MKLTEYIDGVKRTESSLLPLSKYVTDLGLTDRMYHGIIGICTEVGEIVQAYDRSEIDYINVAEEIGDAYWYCAVLFDTLFDTIDMSRVQRTVPVPDMATLPKTLITQSTEMLDKTKKTMFYGKEYCTDLLREQVVQFYFTLEACTIGLKDYINISKEKIWEINLNKLKIRYPEKFNLTDAEVRNLKLERVALEKIN